MGAAALSLLLLSCGSALAQFPNCIPVVDNPELVPNDDGTYPRDPALPYPGGDKTVFTTNKLEIGLAVNDGDRKQFIAEGMNYQPTQIGGSADYPPFQDFFYENDVKTWNPVWDRDVEAMRQMGVNSIRVYATWKWEAGSTVISGQKADPPETSVSAAPHWKKLNFSAGTDAVSQNNKQFCLKNNVDGRTNLIFQHATHKPFLDKLWNNGNRPIYMWIGIGLDKSLIDYHVTGEQRKNLTQFYRYTAKWLAKKYGNHPAVIGFVIGNELGDPDLMSKPYFWDVVNDLNAIIKASAPTKLTMVSFHDTNSYNVPITGKYEGKRGPQVYEPDVWGFNPYNNPASDRNLYDRYIKDVVNDCTTIHDTPCVKPMVYGEFGVPASTHEASSNINKLYPVLWTAPNFVFMKQPPAASCLSSSELGPPPGSGSDGELAEFERRETIAKEMSAAGGERDYVMPKGLVKFFPKSGVQAGDKLKAALQADFIREFWAVTRQHLADNSADIEERKIVSGGYMFEWRDEWWKSKNVDLRDGPMWFHSATGKQVCSNANRCGEGTCQTGSANPVFPGGWGDEQWFGITNASANGRQNSDDVIVPSTGKLNGGPDILRPRAAVVATCEAYRGPGCAD